MAEKRKRPPKALEPLGPEHARFSEEDIIFPPFVVDAYQAMEIPTARATFQKTMREVLENRYDTPNAVTISRIETREVRGYENKGDKSDDDEERNKHDVVEIDIHVATPLFVTPMLLEDLRRFLTYEIDYNKNSGDPAKFQRYTTGRYFDYDHQDKISVNSSKDWKRTNLKDFDLDDLYEDSHRSLEKALHYNQQAMQGIDQIGLPDELVRFGQNDEEKNTNPPEPKPTADLKETRRRNPQTTTLLAIVRQIDMEPSPNSEVGVAPYEIDDVSHVPGIFLHTRRPDETILTAERLATSPQRQELPLETGNEEDMLTDTITLRIGRGKQREFDMYYLTLVLADILQGTHYDNDGSKKGAVAGHYKNEVVEMYTNIMKQRRRERTIQDLPGLEDVYDDMLTTLLGQYPMDIMIVGAPGTGKTELAGLLEIAGEDMLAFSMSIDTFLRQIGPYTAILEQIAQRYNLPLVVILEDAEALFVEGVDRNGAMDGYEAKKRQQVLSTIGTNPNKKSKPLSFVLTVNYPDRADEAFRSRVQILATPLHISKDTILKATQIIASGIKEDLGVAIPVTTLSYIVHHLNDAHTYPMREHVKLLRGLVNVLKRKYPQKSLGSLDWNSSEMKAIVDKLIKFSHDTHQIADTEEMDRLAQQYAQQTRNGSRRMGFSPKPKQ